MASVFWLGQVSGGLAEHGQERASQTWLQGELQRLIAEADLGEKIGVAVADTRMGRLVFTHNANLPLNPASNIKLLTSAVAMWELGPDFVMRTGLYGSVEGDAISGGLYLKGYGDPTLRWTDLLALARELAAQGVRRVDEVAVDGSYFDRQALPPGFDQQPGEAAAFRAPVGAVSVDGNAYALRVQPAPSAGDQAKAYVDMPGYFEIENNLTTSEAGVSSVVAVQRKKGNKLWLRLRGSVPLGSPPRTYRRRVPDPLTYAGHAMAEALRAARIAVPRRARIASTPAGLPLLASRHSPPLAQMLAALGKHSDNFVAEMLFKVLGAERHRRPGRSADGAEVALAVLKRLGIPTEKVSILNGSGLFTGNLMAASHITRLLMAVYNDAGIRSDYLAHLAVGGVDGTLARRFSHLPASRIVRAKTGTLKDVIALSGYVLGPVPERAFAFSVLANGVRGRHQEAKALADGIVQAIASHLWASQI